MQAIQLTWRTATQLLADGDDSVVDSMLGFAPDSRGIRDIIATACLKLPLCGFATPETWSGVHLHRITCQSILCLAAVRLLLVTTSCFRLWFGMVTTHHVCCTCAPAGRPEDMVLMHSFWQLADVYLCILRMPTLKKVWELAPIVACLLMLQLADCAD